MYRYLALIWNPRNEAVVQRMRGLAAPDASADWTCAFEAPGLKVFHAGRGPGFADTTSWLPESSGVLLGRVFEGSGEDARAQVFAPRRLFDAGMLALQGGARLLHEAWGRYVALLHDSLGGTLCVVRDPSGALPCYVTPWQGAYVICSDFEDARDACSLRGSVHWPYIARRLRHDRLQSRDTGLREVRELLPGEQWIFEGDDVRRKMLWNPIERALSHRIEDPDRAVEALRATVRTCVSAWASCYRGVVHNLSGGLDSSIVLSCLARASPRPALTCLHYFSEETTGDERRFARAMAAHVDVPLVEQALDSRHLRLEPLLGIRPSARPWFYLYELEHGAFETRMAEHYGGGAPRAGLFSGSGGDGLFFQGHAEVAVADHLFRHGVTRGLFSTAIDAAMVARRSIWPLLWAAARGRVRGTRVSVLHTAPPISALANASRVHELATDDRSHQPEWFHPSRPWSVPPGLLLHAASITPPLAYYSSFSREPGAERTLPLLAQPLQDLCTRIPSWLLIRGGKDRALARRAFANDLPALIVRRHDKGWIEQHTRQTAQHNLPFLREVLLDGALVREGLLDRRALARALAHPQQGHCTELLHEFLGLEVWLRLWA